MYGTIQYGGILYGSDGSSSGSDEEQFKDLARYVPPFVAELAEMAEIYRTQGYEVGGGEYACRQLLQQCFVQTATWGLLRWEEEYGVKTNLALSYEQRREIILAKMRGQGTTTAEMIRNVAIAFSGGEVEVIEDNAHYNFVVRFVGFYGVPRNMQAFIDMLEEIKPAHLGYSLEYKFVIWNELRPFDWDGLRSYTWDGLRVMEVLPFVSWEGIEGQAFTWNLLSAYSWQEVKKIKEAMG